MAEIKDQIKSAMLKADMTSAELAGKTGMAASSISQYLSGKTRPSDRAITKMAVALDVSIDYLLGNEEKDKPEKKKNLTIGDVARLMHKSKRFVAKGLQEGAFPFGYAVKLSSRWTYFISAEKFTEYTGIHIN